MKPILKIAVLLTTILMVSACQTKSRTTVTITGDLYYNWLKTGSFYNHPEMYEKYKAYQDSIGEEVFKEEDYWQVKLLEKEGLVYSPFIYVKTQQDSIYTVYMQPKDYKPFTKFTYKNLIQTHKKVSIKLEATHLKNNLYLCKKVIAKDKIDGETLQKERKFKIENYQ